MLPETQALINGLDKGSKMSLGGLPPTGQNVGGAAGNINDPAAFAFSAAFRALSKLADILHEQRRTEVANKVAKIAVNLQDLSIQERKRIVENATTEMPNTRDFPTNSGVSNLPAMGWPGQR